ncbi:acyl-CoA dehydrogenase family protein [Aeromicrobium sp. CFBP 8757]|uniref:acyl-CoA dehydrogenase family protein n=1 Tax=Aeromicrobium sp. CFBP 8757 TaxID=2775288 RepID=UPI00178413F7|nr:acyl-CoA dehydrogenase family protein [Aeromicrobium sp. CFBP 8757]MBD8605451.1 acyl-CoA dehydrogenase family protein [Aeromicrobium sp. CFBP 8757]
MTVLDLTVRQHERDYAVIVEGWLARHHGAAAEHSVLDPQESAALWSRADSDLGIAGLLVAEELGGHGAGLREAAVVARALGALPAPIPFVHRAVVATPLLAAFASDDVGRAAATAHTRPALVVPQTLALGSDPFAEIELDQAGELSGTVRAVAAVLDATHLVVPARTAMGSAIVLVAADSSAVTITMEQSLDLSRPVATVELDGASGALLAAGDAAERELRRAVLRGIAMIGSEQAGIARACLTSAVSYTATRHQFGRPIGSFQALKHRMAEMWLVTTSAEAAAMAAADALATDDPQAEATVLAAAVHIGDAAVLAAEESLQLRGGIGMTWEDTSHVMLKRAKVDQVALGSPGQYLLRLAELTGLPPAQPAP